jgi:hypothetical protein
VGLPKDRGDTMVVALDTIAFRVICMFILERERLCNYVYTYGALERFKRAKTSSSIHPILQA